MNVIDNMNEYILHYIIAWFGHILTRMYVSQQWLSTRDYAIGLHYDVQPPSTVLPKNCHGRLYLWSCLNNTEHL